MDTKREVELIGCGATAEFIFEKIDFVADRGYGVIVEPVGFLKKYLNFWSLISLLPPSIC